MPEKAFEVKTFVVDYICDDCGEGRMWPKGEMLLTNPPQYPHRCEHCGMEETYFVKYPVVKYRKRIRKADAIEARVATIGYISPLGVPGSVDGVRCYPHDVILVKDQKNGRDNGLYELPSEDSPFIEWRRMSPLTIGAKAAGVLIEIKHGDQNAGVYFICVNESGSDTVGRDPLNFMRIAEDAL